MSKVGRNAPCPCGSGRKYKKCCLAKDREAESGRHTAPVAEAAQDRAIGRSVSGVLSSPMKESDGYTYEGRVGHACQPRWGLWEEILDRLQPEMTTIDTAESVVNGPEFLDWLNDFSMELSNAALDDPQWAAKGAEFCRQVVTQFSAEEADFRVRFLVDEADFFCRAGQDEAGERAFLGIIADYPDDAGAYAGLADVLFDRGRQDSSLADIERARQLLRDALARPVNDPESYDIEPRLRHIEQAIEDLAKPTGDG